MSPVLVELLAGKPAQNLTGLHHNRYFVIGSILGMANERAEVWGSGFIREGENVIGRPRAIYAVRGPLTRASLLRQGIDCPEVYGDPAILLRRFYDPEVSKTFSVGIIPHYIDKRHTWLERYRKDPRVMILDIESDIYEFVRSVKACETVVSSSLHGLICADTYGVPNAWVQLSNEVIGGDFKFRDYCVSTGTQNAKPVCIGERTTLADCVARAAVRPSPGDLNRLMLACPFLSPELRAEGMTSIGRNAL